MTESHAALLPLAHAAFLIAGRGLCVTPAMEAGIARRPFDVSDLVNLLIEAESKKAA